LRRRQPEPVRQPIAAVARVNAIAVIVRPIRVSPLLLRAFVHQVERVAKDNDDGSGSVSAC
jgi:hypothetical protein